METPEFSVITPSFRQFQWLKLCAASVSDQEGPTHEHIVQDASGDDALRPWASGIPGLRLFTEADEGMYDAINRGLKRANGEICSYLNCDEQYLPGTLARAAKFFREHPGVDILFGDAVLVDARGLPGSYRRVVLPRLAHLRHAHLGTLTCATFFRRRLLDRGFFFDTRWKAIGDAVWMETLLQAQVPMATLPLPMAAFTFTGENLGASALSIKEAEIWKGLPKRFAWLRGAAAVLWHRLEKAKAGAYRRRSLQVALYTLADPTHRQLKIARHAGFGWNVPED